MIAQGMLVEPRHNAPFLLAPTFSGGGGGEGNKSTDVRNVAFGATQAYN